MGLVVYCLNGWYDVYSVFEKVILEDWFFYEIYVIELLMCMWFKFLFVELLNCNDYLSFCILEDKLIGRVIVVFYVNWDVGLIWEFFCCIKWFCRYDVDVVKDYFVWLGDVLWGMNVVQCFYWKDGYW